MWRALCLLRYQSGPIDLWTDCNAVVLRVRKMLRGLEPKPNCAHSDLWLKVFDCLQDFHSDQVSIAKVAAHRSQASAQTPLEEWGFAHNSIADQAANLAQWNRPLPFWQLYDAHVASSKASGDLSRVIQTTLLSL